MHFSGSLVQLVPLESFLVHWYLIGEIPFSMGLRGCQGYFIVEMHLSTRRDIC